MPSPRLIASLSCFLGVCAVAAQQPEDPYIAGYAAAILERELRIPKATVRVKDGVLTLAARDLGNVQSDRVIEVLEAVPGVVRIEIEGAPPAIPPDAARDVPVTPSDGGTRVVVGEADSSLLSNTPLLFEPLHADPRWPHFGAAYHAYGGDELENVATVSFGESFSFYRRPAGANGRWEVGIQAGVFAIFDLDADSKDLVNADYFVGPVVAWRNGPWSVLGRIYHQSSHLGDEYLLRTGVNRLNVSYEVADVLLSVDLADPLRLYAGGGYVLHSEPDLDHWLAQGGVELIGPSAWEGARLVAAIDVQSREHHDWDRDLSVRAGIQLED